MFRLLSTLFCIQLLTSVLAQRSPLSFGAAERWEQRLRKDLLKDYDPSTRPVKDYSTNTSVKMALSVNHIEVNDEDQELVVLSWLVCVWEDEFLKWDPEEYGGLKQLHVDPDEVWKPDVAVYNSALGDEVRPFGSIPLLVLDTGDMIWIPPAHITIKCDIDLQEWPSDKHTCQIRLGSWTHHGKQIDIQILTSNGSGVLLDNYEENNRWKLVSADSSRKEEVEYGSSYVVMDVNLSIQRQASSHLSYFAQSIFVVMLIILVSYFLPLQHHLSKIIIHLFGLTILVACNLTIYSNLPSGSGTIPYIVKYCSEGIILACFSLLSNMILIACFTSTKAFVGGTFAKIANSTPLRKFVSQENPYENFENEIDLEQELSEANSVPSQSHSGSQKKLENKISVMSLYKIINYFIAFIFGLAFLVDYIALRKYLN